MKFSLKGIWKFVVEVIEKFIDDKAPKFGAALSFYTIFSLAPLLMIVIAVAGFIFGEAAAKGRIVTEIQDIMGREGAVIIQTALKNASYNQGGIIAVVISFVTILIGSTIFFVDIQESLNLIWKVKPKPGRGIIKGFLKDRLISFIMVLCSGFLLLVTLIISTIISSINNFVSEQFFEVPLYVLQVVNIIISFGIIFVLCMMVFKFLPNVQIKWKHVWVGALVTALLFGLGKYLIGLYLGTSSLSSTYGAAGSLVVFLLWIYYSSQILFLGAEFTQVYAEKYGEGIRPDEKFTKFDNTSNAIES